MVKNTDFLGSINTNPYFFRHYDLSYFALNVNGKQISTEGLALNMGNEKTSVMGYRTMFEASGIHHSNSGLQITHDMYINGYLIPHVPDIQAFIRRKSTVSNYNKRQLQGLTINVCGKYCCLFAPYTD